jgi:hypothetical protein
LEAYSQSVGPRTTARLILATRAFCSVSPSDNTSQSTFSTFREACVRRRQPSKHASKGGERSQVHQCRRPSSAKRREEAFAFAPHVAVAGMTRAPQPSLSGRCLLLSSPLFYSLLVCAWRVALSLSLLTKREPAVERRAAEQSAQPPWTGRHRRQRNSHHKHTARSTQGRITQRAHFRRCASLPVRAPYECVC